MPLSEPLNEVDKLVSVYKVTWNLKEEITCLGMEEGVAPVDMFIILKALSLIPSTPKKEREKRDDLPGKLPTWLF